MNWYKQRQVMEFIRSRGGLPVDGTGRTLSADEVLAWFGLDEVLTAQEQSQWKEGISAMIEDEAFMERLRLTSQQ